MNGFTLEQLEEIASKLLEKFNASESNLVDITEMAEELGVEVYEGKFEDQEMLGTLVCNSEEKAIYVDEKLDEPEKRYVIATQLAHIILDHNSRYQDTEYIIDFKQPYKGRMTTQDFGEKVQAAILGAALLMPRKLVQKIASETKSVDLIAQYFQVSKRAVFTRLDNLGLL
ncbi:MAG: hypothetical protein Fur003_0320 [Candidatus Dojkabacteria bacterium]